MATTSARPLPAASGHHAAAGPASRVGFTGVLRSEFTKIRSVRSTYWTLASLFVVAVGIGVLVSWASTMHGTNPGPGWDPTAVSLIGLYFGQLVIGVLGVLVISSEYSSGMIRTTLTTNPHRGLMIAGKATVFGLVAFAVGLVTTFVSFFLGQFVMPADGPLATGGHSTGPLRASISDPHVLRAVIGAALFLAVCGLLALGIGLLLRHTAAGIATYLGLMFVVPIVVNFLPQTWLNHVDKWVPAVAGTQIISTVAPAPGDTPMFGPWAGLGVLAAYAVIVLGAGIALFRSRDA